MQTSSDESIHNGDYTQSRKGIKESAGGGFGKKGNSAQTTLSILLVFLTLISAVTGILISVPFASSSETVFEEVSYTWSQEDSEDFERGTLDNVSIEGSDSNSQIVLNVSESSTAQESGTDVPFRVQGDISAVGSCAIKGIGGVKSSRNKGKRSFGKKLSNPVKPNRISFYIRPMDVAKEMRTSFQGAGEREGPVITTKIERGGYTSSGFIMADDGTVGGVAVTNYGSQWTKVTLENIDFSTHTYDLVLEGLEYGITNSVSDIKFKQNINNISSVRLTVGSESVSYWDCMKMDGASVFDLSGPRKLISDLQAGSEMEVAGTFVSPVFDTYQNVGDGEVKNVEYDELEWYGSGLDDIRIQIAYSENGSDWSGFVGPDGTGQTYYHDSSPYSHKATRSVGGRGGYRYVKYKVYFLNSEEAPRLDGVEISYTITKSDSPTGERGTVTYRYEVSQSD